MAKIKMKTSKHFQGYKITKYDNDTACYVYHYENIDCTRPYNSEMGFNYAKKKFSINDENYTSHREEGKTVYIKKN